jgi:DNA-directed RNA polymerase specialized sigma24 family protein/bifunctional DNase/RNase
VSADVSDGDLARLARGGDPAAFRLLVERHQPMVRARARQLAPDPGDVDDIVQESFLQAFLALDRLRDPDRFAGWLAGIALRAAVAGLPAGQRRAVTLHYYADVPAGQVGEASGAARPSLHKARLKLRAYLTEHRPDLVPASGRTPMTTVRVARIERRIPSGPVPDRFPTHVIVLADDAGRRDLPIWLLGGDSHRFDDPRPSADELTGRLLRAAGTRVTAVVVDELGPEVTAARIELATPAAPEHVTVRLLDGLAIAITAGAPIRVADTVMDRLAVSAGAGQAGPMPEQTARDLAIDQRPRYEPRNLTCADGLDHWVLGGSFTENAIQSHWQDYSAAADHGSAVLSSAVPQPEGFAWLAQEIFADDYRGTSVTFRGQFRAPGTTGRAGLFLRVTQPQDVRGSFTAQAALADPANHIVNLQGPGDWATHEVTAPIPDEANTVTFGVFLAGPGRIELRNAELTRAELAE